MATLVHKQIFVGGMTSDTHPKNIEVGDYLKMYNMRNTKTSGNEYGSAVNVKGNVLVPFELPQGENVVIGKLEDKQKERIFYWVYNSLGSHSLMAFETQTNIIYYVLNGRYLNLQKDWYITQPSIIDGSIVQWGETKVRGVNIDGNPPRYVDTNRAILFNKKCEFDIVFADYENLVSNYYIELSINGETKRLGLGYISSNDKNIVYEELSNLINGNSEINSIIEASSCGGCRLEVKFKTVGDSWVKILSDGGYLYTLPQNRYHKDLDETSIKLGRLVPTCQPRVKMVQDFDYAYNYVYDKYFQFAIRYVYWDGQKSTFSNFSTVANIPVGCDGSEDSFNAIEIDFYDEILTNEIRLADIKYIEIVARNGNTGSFVSVEKIDVCDIDFNTLTYTFRNDGSYPQISDEEAYRAYSHIPLLATSHLVVDDRSFWGGTIERYNNLECVEASADVEYTEDVVNECEQEFVTIKGKVRIYNRMSDRDGGNLAIFQNQPIWTPNGTDYYFGGVNNRKLLSPRPEAEKCANMRQRIPLGGFTAYLAGTNYYATSKQIPPTNGVNANPDGVYIITNDDDAKDVIDMANNGGVWSEFEIKNVPKGGKYILRLSSHLISKTDNQYGSAYNIESGLWQQTSTYIRNFHEIPIDTNVEGDVIDLTGQEFLINDTVTTGEFRKGCALIEGYVVDGITNHNGDIEYVNAGISIDKVLFNESSNKDNYCHSPNKQTDHNGYFYIAIQEPARSSPGIIGIGNLTKFNLSVRGAGETLYGNNKFKLLDGETPSLQTTVSIFTSNNGNSTSVTFFNHSELLTNACLQTVKIKALESEEQRGLSGISVVFAGTNRILTTSAGGIGEIRLYYDTFASLGYYQMAFVVDDANCCPKILNNDVSYSVGISLFTDNISKGYWEANSIICELAKTQNGVWKHRNRLQFGIVYEDEYNRASKVQTADSMSVYIPFWTEPNADKGNPVITWEINHTPPSWAKKYQIVRTLNSFYSRYLQFVIDEPRYVIGYDESGEIVDTTYASRQATHVYIPLSSLVTYGEDNVGSILSWDVSANDRVTFMKDSNGEWFNGFFDFRVQNDKVKTIDDVTYLVIRFDQSQPELKAGATIEVYSMQPESSVDMYYTIGECYGIRNGYHLGGFEGQNQTENQPATGKIVLGDTYIQSRKMPYTENDTQRFLSSKYESMYMNETIADSRVQHIGRLVTEDRDYGQVFYYTRVRHTGRYLPDTNINLLNQSAELEYIKDDNGTEIDRQFGVLASLQFTGSLILAVLQFKCVPIYTNATPVFDLQGGSILTKSRSIATIAQPFREDKGCQNPESITVENGNVYGFDRQKHAWWRYGFNGLYDISDYEMHSEFDHIASQLSAYDPVFSAFDRGNGELITIFPTLNRILSFNETLSGDAGKNRWMTEYTHLVPDMMGMQGDYLVSWKNGQLWVHHRGEHGNFYGQQVECGVDFVVNNQPDVKKIFTHLRVKSTDKFYTAPNGIESYISESLAPMVSQLKENRFERLEGDYWADFLRDMTDPEFKSISNADERRVTALLKGRVLRGDYMVIKLRNNSNKNVNLYSVDVHSIISNNTNE